MNTALKRKRAPSGSVGFWVQVFLMAGVLSTHSVLAPAAAKTAEETTIDSVRNCQVLGDKIKARVRLGIQSNPIEQQLTVSGFLETSQTAENATTVFAQREVRLESALSGNLHSWYRLVGWSHWLADYFEETTGKILARLEYGTEPQTHRAKTLGQRLRQSFKMLPLASGLDSAGQVYIVLQGFGSVQDSIDDRVQLFLANFNPKVHIGFDAIEEFSTLDCGDQQTAPIQVITRTDKSDDSDKS